MKVRTQSGINFILRSASQIFLKVACNTIFFNLYVNICLCSFKQHFQKIKVFAFIFVITYPIFFHVLMKQSTNNSK